MEGGVGSVIGFLEVLPTVLWPPDIFMIAPSLLLHGAGATASSLSLVLSHLWVSTSWALASLEDMCDMWLTWRLEQLPQATAHASVKWVP